jgi:protein-tyrosine phosphatase
MEIVDIHSHVLPGVDDGAVSVDETIAMLRIAYDAGTRRIVATPHMFHALFHNNDFVQILDRFEQLKSELKSCQDAFPFLQDMQLYSGAENFASPEFLTALDQGCVLTLNGSRYLLIEFPPALPFVQMQTFIKKVLSTDYTPIIAHPERYGVIQKDPLRVEQFQQTGSVIQVNADSIRGGSGSRAKQCSRSLLQAGLVDVIASDG